MIIDSAQNIAQNGTDFLWRWSREKNSRLPDWAVVILILFWPLRY
jgi:hypothetical protein